MDRLSNLDYELFVQTPIGIIPYGLEDLNPWAHVEGPSWIWNSQPDHIKIQSDLEKFGLVNRMVIPIDISDTEDLHNRVFGILGIEPAERDPEATKTAQIIDKMCVLYNIDYRDATRIMNGATFVMSRTGRIRNVIDSKGVHLISPRLAEGGLSLTVDGAKIFHAA